MHHFGFFPSVRRWIKVRPFFFFLIYCSRICWTTPPNQWETSLLPCPVYLCVPCVVRFLGAGRSAGMLRWVPSPVGVSTAPETLSPSTCRRLLPGTTHLSADARGRASSSPPLSSSPSRSDSLLVTSSLREHMQESLDAILAIASTRRGRF